MKIVDILVEAEEVKARAPRGSSKAYLKQVRKGKKPLIGELKNKRERLDLRAAARNKKKEEAPVELTVTDNGLYDAMDEAYDMLSYYDDDVATTTIKTTGSTGSFEKIIFTIEIEADPADVKSSISRYNRYVEKIEKLFDYPSNVVDFNYKPFPKTVTGDNLQSKLVITVK
jgi:hypothetical protein